MYNQPFYIPGYYSSAIPSMVRGATIPGSILNGASMGAAGRGAGLFSKLGGAFGTLRSLNWGGIINNTSRTLGIINQTIPLVRQVGPMVGNMRSMLKLASVFKDETDTGAKKNNVSKSNSVNVRNNDNIKNNDSNNSNTTNNVRTNSNVSSVNNSKVDIDELETETYISSNNYDGSPTFFIN